MIIWNVHHYMVQNMNDEIVEIVGEFVAETDMAILLDDGDNEVWLPKSQIDYDADANVGATIDVTIPEWLAIQEGLV